MSKYALPSVDELHRMYGDLTSNDGLNRVTEWGLGQNVAPVSAIEDDFTRAFLFLDPAFKKAAKELFGST